VLVVVSTVVALGIVVLAILASNGIGPNPDQLDGSAPARRTPAAAVQPSVAGEPVTPSVTDGR
jgi:hypothetical protein